MKVRSFFSCLSWLVLVLALVTGGTLRAEEGGEDAPAPPPPKKATRKYMVPDPNRVDAGVFHVGFAVGGNFYIEPQIDNNTGGPNGDYFKDFGFQAGVYFDYDYSALTENVPLSLRGMLGYKRILKSVNVFTFDGAVRHMWRFSERATFGAGIGGSAAIWFREPQNVAPLAAEEIIFLPSFLITFGFEYNPFMVDVKWLINRFGQDSTITGVELYFGFRL